MGIRTSRGFTIIELLVVVSIIALLVGILLPAIGKAREQALYTQSQSNLRNMATANATYSSEWKDKQFTLINDNIASYNLGGSLDQAFTNFSAAHNGEGHPFIILGQQSGTLIVWVIFPSERWNQPINFDGEDAGIGSFRMVNVKSFSNYLNGRFYDPIFYAPKDRSVLAVTEPLFEDPSEFPAPALTGSNLYLSSYCWSPAAMLNPDVMSEDGFTAPMDLSAGFRTPTVSQAKFPEMKTQMWEHHWLQNSTKDCNWLVQDGRYDGCEPYYFNHSIESAPVTMFFDGHIEPLGQRDAIQGSKLVEGSSPSGLGLWHTGTPLGGDTNNNGCGGGGYFMDIRTDWTCTSHNVLTTNGILGRDKGPS